MPPNDTRTPSLIIGELLGRHPEAASLQAEASHRRALAASSAADASGMLAAVQAARLGWDELRHRLDPRCFRTVNFAVGLLALAVLGAGLTLLDRYQLGALHGRAGSVLLALAAAAVWMTGAWLIALASRERRRPVVLFTGAGGLLLGLLLTALYGPSRSSLLFGSLTSVFIVVLVAGAAVLMTRMESASLLVARRRWHRARHAHEAALQLHRDDLQAAAVATEAWLGLVRACAVAEADEQLAHQTVALAVALLEGGRPQLPSLNMLPAVSAGIPSPGGRP